MSPARIDLLKNHPAATKAMMALAAVLAGSDAQGSIFLLEKPSDS